MTLADKKRTYEKRIGYVVIGPTPKDHPGVLIAGVRWGTIDGVVGIMPDYADVGGSFRSLPAGVTVANTTYDGMVVL